MNYYNTYIATNSNSQRRKLEQPRENEKVKIEKEIRRHQKMTTLTNKYFQKIVNEVNKANQKGKKSIKFYFNYYDFINEGLGKPLGFLNEFMYEMSYIYSIYVPRDTNGNSITFKTLFGEGFKWNIIGKKVIELSW